MLVVAFWFMLHYSAAPDVNPSETAIVVLQSKSALFFTLFGILNCEKWLQRMNTFLPTDNQLLYETARQRAGRVHRIFRSHWGSTFCGTSLLQMTRGHHESSSIFLPFKHSDFLMSNIKCEMKRFIRNEVELEEYLGELNLISSHWNL